MFIGILESMESLARLLVESLANGLWQGLALALVVTLALRFVPRLSARARYTLVGTAFFVALALPALSSHTKLLDTSDSARQAVRKFSIEGEMTPSTPEKNLAQSGDALHTTQRNPAHTTEVDGSQPNSLGLLAGSAETSGLFKDNPPDASKARISGAHESRNESSHEPSQAVGSQQTRTPIQRPTVESPSQIIPSWSAPLSDTTLWLILGVWVAIAIGSLIRLAQSYAHLQKLKRNSQELPGNISRRLRRYAEDIQVARPVSFLHSNDVTMPLAVGFGATSVIYPSHLIESLSNDEIDQIAIHELAHLKRYDDWACLAQRFALALFFFNPALLWLGRRFELERELACDEFVLEYGAGAQKYATCLTRLVELTRSPGRFPRTALAAGEFVNRSRLSVRVERILNRKLGLSRRGSGAVVMTGVLLIFALAAQFVLSPNVVAFEEPQSAKPALKAKLKTVPEVAAVSLAPLPEITVPLVPTIAAATASARTSASAISLAAVEESDSRASYRLQRNISKLRKQLNELGNSNTDSTQNTLFERRDELREELRRLRYELRKLTRQSQTRQVVVAPAPGAHGYRLGTVTLAPGNGESILFSEDGTNVTVAPTPDLGHNNHNNNNNHNIVVYSGIGEEPTYQSVTLGKNGYAYIYDNDGGEPIHLIGGSTVKGIGSFNGVFDFGDGEVHYSWRDGGRRISVRSKGDVTFTDDDSDVSGISDEGFIIIQERRRGVDREYEVYAYEDGALERTYYEDGRRREIDDEATEWISEIVLRTVRNTGIGADARVGRLLKAGGVDAVLTEIEEIESSHSQRLYYDALLEADHGFTSGEYVKIINQLSLDIESDFERAEFLSQLDEEVLGSPEVIEAFVKAVDYIDSDFEKRRALTPVLGLRDLPAETLVGLLEVADNFDSDFERAELLSAVSRRGLTDPAVQRAYVDAVIDIDSDFEKRRVLTQITDVRDLDQKTLLTALKIAGSISSDFERAELLIDLYPHANVDDELLAAYVNAIEDISSNFEKRRVLNALTDRRTLTPDITLSVLNMAQTISSDYERAELLIDMSRYCSNEEQCWEAYVQAVGDLSSDYEKSRVLQKIAFNEPDEKTLLAILDVVEEMSSDFEKSKILRDLMDVCLESETLREKYLDTVDSLDSDYERNKLIDRIYKKERREKRRGR